MTKRIALLLTLTAVLLTATWAVCQQTKRTRNAAITAQSMELDWDKGVIDFTGIAGW